MFETTLAQRNCGWPSAHNRVRATRDYLAAESSVSRPDGCRTNVDRRLGLILSHCFMSLLQQMQYKRKWAEPRGNSGAPRTRNLAARRSGSPCDFIKRRPVTVLVFAGRTHAACASPETAILSPGVPERTLPRWAHTVDVGSTPGACVHWHDQSTRR